LILLTLSQRQKRRKLTLFYKIHYKNVPSFLSDMLTPINQPNNPYLLRNNHNDSNPRCRLNCYIKPFILSTIKLWNDLIIQTRNSPSTNTFKNNMRTYCDFAPSYYTHNYVIYVYFNLLLIF